MEPARTVPEDFPTEGVELSYFLVVSDYARALASYRDVLGTTVVRELPGTLGFLNFRGSQILLSATGSPTKDTPLVTFVSPPDLEQRHRRTDHPGAGLLGCLRCVALPRSRVHHSARRVGR